MPSTDEMILELVARGFALPEGLELDVGSVAPWLLRERGSSGGSFWILSKTARDLCAMEFARQVDACGRSMFNLLMAKSAIITDEAEYRFDKANRVGDSAAAIKALWEATK